MLETVIISSNRLRFARLLTSFLRGKKVSLELSVSEMLGMSDATRVVGWSLMGPETCCWNLEMMELETVWGSEGRGSFFLWGMRDRISAPSQLHRQGQGQSCTENQRLQGVLSLYISICGSILLLLSGYDLRRLRRQPFCCPASCTSPSRRSLSLPSTLFSHQAKTPPDTKALPNSVTCDFPTYQKLFLRFPRENKNKLRPECDI